MHNLYQRHKPSVALSLLSVDPVLGLILACPSGTTYIIKGVIFYATDIANVYRYEWITEED